MLLRDIMTLRVRTIAANATVEDAAMKMAEENVGALPVCDDDQLIGIVTDRDIVIRSTAAGRDPRASLVRDVMTSPVTCGFDDQDIEEGGTLMQEKLIRRLPVLDRDHRLVGIVSADDLMIAIPTRAADMMQTIADVERPGG